MITNVRGLCQLKSTMHTEGIVTEVPFDVVHFRKGYV